MGSLKKDKNDGFTPTPKSLVWGFTILELIVVIVLVGILAAMALPGYNKTKEKQYDKEAQANLKLIMAAEKVYRMETGSYLTAATNNLINDNLRLALSTGTNKLWDYKTYNTGCIEATRATDATIKWRVRPTTPNGEPSTTETACP